MSNAAPRWWCDLCGLELTPDAEHHASLRWFGKPPDRPSCSASPSGRHSCDPVRVSMGLQIPGGGYHREARECEDCPTPLLCVCPPFESKGAKAIVPPGRGPRYPRAAPNVSDENGCGQRAPGTGASDPGVRVAETNT